MAHRSLLLILLAPCGTALLALITPDHTELPEVVETTLKISGGADVLTTAFNKRGNLLAGGCSDGRVVVWDFDTYGIARELRGHAGPVTSVSWTRSSRRVLSGDRGIFLIYFSLIIKFYASNAFLLLKLTLRLT